MSGASRDVNISGVSRTRDGKQAGHNGAGSRTRTSRERVQVGVAQRVAVLLLEGLQPRDGRGRESRVAPVGQFLREPDGPPAAPSVPGRLGVRPGAVPRLSKSGSEGEGRIRFRRALPEKQCQRTQANEKVSSFLGLREECSCRNMHDESTTKVVEAKSTGNEKVPEAASTEDEAVQEATYAADEVVPEAASMNQVVPGAALTADKVFAEAASSVVQVVPEIALTAAEVVAETATTADEVVAEAASTADKSNIAFFQCSQRATHHERKRSRPAYQLHICRPPSNNRRPCVASRLTRRTRVGPLSGSLLTIAAISFATAL